MSPGERVEGAPDIVLVVLDCVRASEWPPGGHVGRTLRAIPWIKARAIAFDRATSPAAWTLPAHASLFTGRYPWEHRLHGKGATVLDGRFPTIAEELAGAGYYTFSLSANGQVGPRFGLTRGFHHAETAAPRELYQRFGRSEPRPVLRAGRSRSEPFGGGWSETERELLSSTLGLPLLWDSANRLGARLTRTRRAAGRIAPWIEAEFDRAVARIPDGQPMFAFVNLLDAHEPYPVDSCDGSRHGRFRPGLVNQNKRRWASGRWLPSASETERLTELYRHAIARLDDRLATLVQTLRSRGRWDRTLLVITSDHGQAFGEGGVLYHELSVDDPIVRVPLWVRLPGDRRGGTRSDASVSLVDILPTARDLLGVSPMVSAPGRSLLTSLEDPRTEPVFSASEGLLWGQWPRLPAIRRTELDVVRVRADTRTGSYQFPYPNGAAPASTAWTGTPAEIDAALRGIAAEIASGGGARDGTEALQHLEEWGY